MLLIKVTNTSINSQNVAKFVYKYISENAVIHDRLSLAKKRTKCRLDINIFHSLFLICSVLSNKPSASALKGTVEAIRNLAI